MNRKTLNKDNRRKVWNKYKGHCAYCGRALDLKDMQADHIVPFSKKTDNDYKNLNPACRVCNKWKGVWSVEEFRNEIQMQIERLNNSSAGFRLAIRYGLIEPSNKNVEFHFEAYDKILAERLHGEETQ